MKRELLNHIVSPDTLQPFELFVFSEDHEEIEHGVLVDTDGNWFPIRNCVPRLIPPQLRRNLVHSDWCNQFASNLQELQLPLDGEHDLAGSEADKSEEELKLRIAEKFGFEWEEFSDFGWSDPQFDQQNAAKAFAAKTGFSPDELNGQLVLDAGCGNGRYATLAGQYGAKVIGVELFDEVDVAFKNTQHNPDIHIVQGDVFSLPLRNGLFDAVFSIGVLQHTGNAARAFDHISTKVKPGGRFAVAVYGKGNFMYEAMMHFIRGKTSKMSTAQQMAFVRRFMWFTAMVKNLRLTRFASRLLFVEHHAHLLFNRYAVPVATHHTVGEVQSWYESNGFEVSTYSPRKKRNKLFGAAPSVRAVGQKTAGKELTEAAGNPLATEQNVLSS